MENDRRAAGSWRSAGPALLGALLAAGCAVSGGAAPGGARSDETTTPRARTAAPPRVRTGLDVLQAEGFARLRGKRVGLVTNASGVDGRLRPASELIARAPGVTLAAIFAPEHGFGGSLPAGAAVGDARDPVTGAAVFSLYGATRKPGAAMLRGIDLLLFDIQDVGARTYTYLSTLRGVLEAGAEAGIPVLVLDRPDPTGGEIADGPVLEPGRESFVGPHTIALRQGMTPGEMARMMNEERGIGARLEVVPLQGWRRGMSFPATGLPWVAPSPNIPTPGTAFLFPGFVLLEATNLSEGRGTTRPFRLFGAPWLDARRVAEELNRLGLDGVLFRATEFTPTESKHKGERCAAIEVHLTDPRRFRAAVAAAAVISVVRRLHPDELKVDADVFDRLAGTVALRLAIFRGDSPEAIAASWAGPLEEFRKRRERFLLYR